MKHRVSKEILYHFNCGNCNKWWSIADYHLLSLNNTENLKYNKKITCPQCGHQEKAVENDKKR